jgi:hypothetical protein
MKKEKRIRCDFCGRYISYKDMEIGKAVFYMVTPDSHFTCEKFETICRSCNE